MLRAKLMGANELKVMFDTYGKQVLRPGAKAGVTESVKAVTTQAKQLVPRRTGSLRRSIGWKVVAKREGFGYLGVVGPRRDKRHSKSVTPEQGEKPKRKKMTFRRKVRFRGLVMIVNPAKYAHLVEYGRRAVKVKKKKVMADGKTIYGKEVRAVPPHPFMRPAWEELKDHCEWLIKTKLQTAIAKSKLKS